MVGCFIGGCCSGSPPAWPALPLRLHPIVHLATYLWVQVSFLSFYCSVPVHSWDVFIHLGLSSLPSCRLIFPFFYHVWATFVHYVFEFSHVLCGRCLLMFDGFRDMSKWHTAEISSILSMKTNSPFVCSCFPVVRLCATGTLLFLVSMHLFHFILFPIQTLNNHNLAPLNSHIGSKAGKVQGWFFGW